MDLAVAAGSVHAVVGKNGGGKSTLMRLLVGAIDPDSGEIRIGQVVRLRSPADARAHGVGIGHQELSVLPERSILTNLFVTSPPTRWGIVDTREMRRQDAPVLSRIGLDVDPTTALEGLGVGERQLVELTRLLIKRPRVLILDEPNSALTIGLWCTRQRGRLGDAVQVDSYAAG
jgi:ribose transport system ATP-binding protein